VKPISFDEGVAEAVLAATRGFGPAASRQGASEARSSSSCAVENAATKGRRLRDPIDQGCHQEQPALALSSEDEVRVVELAEAGGATSTSAATRVVRWGFGSSGREGGRE
jgi:hypothetical protein